MSRSRKSSKGKRLQDPDLGSYGHADPPMSSQSQQAEPPFPFNVEAYHSFCESLPEVVKNGSFGKWGSLYAETVGAVVRIVKDGTTKCLSGFVIYRTDNYAIVMTANNDFCPKELVVYNYHLKELAVERIYHASNMDFSLLQVGGEIDCLHALQFDLSDLSFGQKIFSISCPLQEMFARPHELESDQDLFNFVNTVLFCMSRGHVNHPCYVGIHRINSAGNFVNFYARGLYFGSFGSHLFNDKGRVVGMVVCANTDASQHLVTDWALSMQSIVSWMESRLSNGDQDLRAMAGGFLEAIRG